MKTILFDLDGTLTDPQVGITTCIKYALDKLGQSYENNLDWCIGPPLQDSFMILCQGDEEKTQKAVVLYRERFSVVGLFENEVYEGIVPMLETLMAHPMRLFVATSKPQTYAQKIIEHFKLDQYFERVFGAELDGTRADKGELIKYILEKTQCNPQDTYMVGDRKFDLIGASKNKISGIGILWGYGSLGELVDENALALLSTPLELTNYLLKIKSDQ